MRKGLRLPIFGLLLTLAAGAAALAPAGARAESDRVENGAVRLTVEIQWGQPGLPPLPGGDPAGGPTVELEPSEGRIVEAVAWPPGPGVSPPTGARPTPLAGSAWTLGPARGGRVRVRVEAPIHASLQVQAGGVTTRFPLSGLLEGPQRTGVGAAVPIQVERLAWDALEVHLAEGDGTAAPGATVPVTLGFNLLAAEPGPMAVHYTAELRPIRSATPVWRVEGPPEVLSSNQLNPPARVLNVPMPPEEGTYLLEVRCSWEPAEAIAEGSRISRLLRRRRNGAAVVSSTASRRVSLAVVGPRVEPEPATGPALSVDATDLTRPRGRVVGSGRAPAALAATPGPAAWSVPEAALVEPGLRDRLRGWITRAGAEAATLPPADPTGLAWSALSLKVPRPGRPHRLNVTVVGGHPEALGVALVVPGTGGARPRVLLDACLSAGPVGDGQPGVVGSWPVWPDAPEPVLVLVNRGERGPVRIGAIELTELPAGPEPATLAETHPQAPRMLAVNLTGPAALDRFGGAVEGGPAADSLALGQNLGAYLAHVGASTAILPDSPAGDRKQRAALDGQAAEDAVGPDQLPLLLRLLGRRGLSALVEVRLDGPLPGLPGPDSAEAVARGLVRLDARGQADRTGGPPAYQPLHPEVQAALRTRLNAAIAPRLAYPNLAGLLLRLGPGPTLPGGPETGLDDVTYAAFVKATFQSGDAAQVPGLGTTGPDRFAARARFVTGPGRLPWLDWRCAQVGALYGSLAEAVQTAAPGALLAVATPGLDPGPAGVEARRADRAGQSPQHGWRAVGLDLDRWPAGPHAPVVLRSVELAGDDLTDDLASSPELDAAVAARPRRGLLIGSDTLPWLTSTDPTAPAQLAGQRPLVDDRPLGHALAVLDPRWVVVEAGAVTGQEERLARFSRVFRSLPGPADATAPPRPSTGVAVRTWTDAGRTYVALANDTPYEILQATVVHPATGASIDDLGRGLRLEPVEAPGGGRQLVLRLPPFGVAAVRISSPEARVESSPPYLPALASLEAQAADLSDRIGRLAQDDGVIGPPSPGFEPIAPAPAAEPVQAASTTTRPPTAAIPGMPELPLPALPGLPLPPGWSAAGDPVNRIALDTESPHAGRGALRVEAQALPASVASDPFLPPGGTTLTVRAWLRADRPDAPVRVWVEGQAGGRSIVRQADLPPVGPEWAERLVRVPDLPEGGLERVRLRFEWLGPAGGRFWLDDVALEGQGPSEPARRARRILTEALAAYRLKHYADFARLLGSNRVRQAAPETLNGPDALRTGQATDLPPNRRLR